MKVMCINDKWRKSPEQKNKPHPVFGETYTKTGEADVFGRMFIELKEFPESFFLSENFAPISDIDETQMVRNLQTETA